MSILKRHRTNTHARNSGLVLLIALTLMVAGCTKNYGNFKKSAEVTLAFRQGGSQGPLHVAPVGVVEGLTRLLEALQPFRPEANVPDLIPVDPLEDASGFLVPGRARRVDAGENRLELIASPFSIYHEIEAAYVVGDFRVEPADSGFVIEPEPRGLVMVARAFADDLDVGCLDAQPVQKKSRVAPTSAGDIDDDVVGADSVESEIDNAPVSSRRWSFCCTPCGSPRRCDHDVRKVTHR